MMDSFLAKKKTQQSYEEKISTEPKGTQLCKKYAVKIFGEFVSQKYPGKTTDVVEELIMLRYTQNSQTYEETMYGVLQEWINWNEKRGLGNYNTSSIFESTKILVPSRNQNP